MVYSAVQVQHYSTGYQLINVVCFLKQAIVYTGSVQVPACMLMAKVIPAALLLTHLQLKYRLVFTVQ
jgi:hypothetical protein